VATGAVIGAIAFLVLRTVKGENVTELRDRSSRLETENRDLRDEIIKCKANREWLETHGCPGMQEQDGCSPHTCTVVERIRVDFGMEKVPWPELPDAVRNKINLMEQRYEESEAAISSLNNKIINNKEQARGVDDARNEIPKLQDEVLELESRWNGLRVDNENIKTLNEHYHDQVQHGCKASCPSCQPCPACNCSQNSTDPAK
jgi:gas vesicle protein